MNDTPDNQKPDSDKEKLDRMSRSRLMQVAADCGIRFDLGWTKDQLKEAILKTVD